MHIGNNFAVYSDPRGVEPPLTWYHAGFANTSAAIAWTRWAFGPPAKLLVTGFSAGGTGTAAAYWFVRNGLAAVARLHAR